MKPGDIRMMLMKVQVFKHSKHQQLQEIRLLESKIRWKIYSNFKRWFSGFLEPPVD
jgi:hypothetical protein